MERFPRIYRHTVTRRLSDAALDFQERLLEAQSLRGQHRINALRQADGALNRVRIYLRLIHHWRWLNDSQYEHVSRMVMELGRMLGGWIKRTEPTRK
ncbi:MAG: four helix bundle protein [Rhodobacteraceae bacterium]|nr:four helix bundle protein [Paracoccaceae bacterium]